MLPFFTPGRVGAVIVGASLLLLFALEPLFTPKQYRFEGTPSKEGQDVFPLDQGLSVYLAGEDSSLSGASRLSLREIFSKIGPKKQRLIVNFWATWCDPCIEEIPSLNLLYLQLQQNRTEPFPEIITISVDEKKEAITKLQKTMETKMQFPILHDPDGTFARALGVIKFPETFLINSDGKILYKWIGPQDWLSMETLEFLKFMHLAN